jgi:hydroxymethylbilane synthase
MTAIRIATRASDLALIQARSVADRVDRELGAPTEIVPLTTTGDREQDVSLAKIGGKGLFVKEIDEALLDGRADVAVHSAKDLPAVLAEGLEIVAFPQRADCRDALIARETGVTLHSLRTGARIGTGSARRAAQLQRHQSDIEIVALRGNVATRLKKMDDQNLDAVILACAGLDRLGREDLIAQRIPTDIVLPAIGQGALAIVVRSGGALSKDLTVLNDPQTACAVLAERGFLLRMGGDCTTPLACLAESSSAGMLRVRGLVAAMDGSRIARGELEVEIEKAESGGAQLAERILASGGEELLAQSREEVGA